MATYDHEKVLADYGHGKIDVEMAMGHALQHIGHLYVAQSAANADRQALRKRVDTLEATVTHLQKVQTERLQILENGLTSLQQTVIHWKADVANLTVPTTETMRPVRP